MSGLTDQFNCGPADAGLFYNVQQSMKAVDKCLDCPVMVGCREQARQDGEIYGVWGGETAEERCAWLAASHPDPAVRSEAATELREAEHRRDSARRRRVQRVKPEPKSRSVQHREQRRSAVPTRQAVANEAAAKARELRAAGNSPAEVAHALGVPKRTVERYLSARYDNITL